MIGEVERLLDKRVEVDAPTPIGPPRECSNMLLTMPSARRPFSVIFSRLLVSTPTTSSISARLSSSSAPGAVAATDFSSPKSSTERLAKLLTKLSGFLISWAIPAVT